jgi:hypothetical protein
MTVLMMFADRQEELIVQTSAPTVIDGGVWRSGGTDLRSGLQLAGDGGLGYLEEQVHCSEQRPKHKKARIIRSPG